MPRIRRGREQGQALVAVALTISLLAMLMLTCIEIGGRYLQRAVIEDALRQSTRSAVQTFDYAAFAANSQRVRETTPVAVTGCASLTRDSARAYACAVLLDNLQYAQGLEETADQTSARVQWILLPQGGTCTFPGRAPISFSTPAVCASLSPRMTGLLGWGIWMPQLDAADTLDHT